MGSLDRYQPATGNTSRLFGVCHNCMAQSLVAQNVFTIPWLHMRSAIDQESHRGEIPDNIIYPNGYTFQDRRNK